MLLSSLDKLSRIFSQGVVTPLSIHKQENSIDIWICDKNKRTNKVNIIKASHVRKEFINYSWLIVNNKAENPKTNFFRIDLYALRNFPIKNVLLFILDLKIFEFDASERNWFIDE